MVVSALQVNSAQHRLQLHKTVLLVHILMDWDTNLKLSATYVRMVMFVQPLAKVTIPCSQHHVQPANGVVPVFHQLRLLLFVRLDINVPSVQLCKFPVLLANIIQVLERHKIHAQLARQETIVNSGIPFLQVKLHKN
jgi:hypothetical protein